MSEEIYDDLKMQTYPSIIIENSWIHHREGTLYVIVLFKKLIYIDIHKCLK